MNVDRGISLFPLAGPSVALNVCTMKNDVVEVAVKGVMPTGTGCAVFLGNANSDKIQTIHVEMYCETMVLNIL
jgi:hypothetical protein